VKDLVVDNGIAPCPSHRGKRKIAPIHPSIESCISQGLFASGNVEPASTLPYQPYLVLYLVFEDFLRYHQEHCPCWLRTGYLVLYLTPLFPPETLIIGMVLSPLLHIHIATLEISRILLHPSLLALPFAFRPTQWILTTLLNLPRPRVRPVIPSAVDTHLLSSLCRFHRSILDRGCVCQLIGNALSRNEKNEIHPMCGVEIKMKNKSGA